MKQRGLKRSQVVHGTVQSSASGPDGTQIEPIVVDESLIIELATPSSWSVSLGEIIFESTTRLDAEHYDPKVSTNMEALQESGRSLVPLRDLAEIRLPNQFTRIWAQDAEHGTPYLNATDLMSYAAFGLPAQERYLSKASSVDINKLLIQKAWILVTCSGTIGRVFEVPDALDGWVATHDIIRIIPYDNGLRGYIKAFLCSDFAQVQILKHTHGGQIDHITDIQLGSCLIPMLEFSEMKRISKLVDRAEILKRKAAEHITMALESVNNGLIYS